jgi:hypothetical protein
MPRYSFLWKNKKHVKEQEERIRHLEKELNAAREETCKVKAGNVSSNFMEQDYPGNWGKKNKQQTNKKSNSRSHRFSANDACEV